MKKCLFLIIFFLSITITSQNTSYWQQKADYIMSIDMNVANYQYNGKQQLLYTNNSPDTLKTVFYHLFFNAFQPGSEMDIRLHHIADPDSRMVINVGTKDHPVYQSRIENLKPNEIGYLKVISLQQDGSDVQFKTIGTILKVRLNKPIEPGQKSTFNMSFKGQVPVQIRRSGRNNKEGVALSMSQWYPKLAEYDFEGWHADAYIAREFFGVWGDFDVKIKIDKNYVIGGSGYLQNPNEVGHGYETGKIIPSKSEKLTWHFIAPNVHDFTWAADPEYIHDKIQGENGVTLHFFYKNNPTIKDNWKKLQPLTAQLLSYYNKHIGKYPYKQYSVIQGGDGGMEYAMCTLINGEHDNFNGLFSVTAHEFAHSWFQFLLATNETEHPWMDEGFTSYISSLSKNEIMKKNLKFPNESAYNNYISLAKSGVEEPQSLFSDRFQYNFAYGASAYSKGEVFLAQLGYIIGENNLHKTLKKYYKDFKFKHPSPNDFIRTAEKASGLQLRWYLNEWTQTTHVIDYAVTEIDGKKVKLENKGSMPMPIDLKVTYTDDSTEIFYIPLRMLLGLKPTSATILNDWPWVQPTYSFTTLKNIQSVEIDDTKRMADIDRNNNILKVNKN